MSASDDLPRSLPLIGLTTYRQRAQSGVWDVDAVFLPGVYVDGVSACGGVATLLPPQAAGAATAATAERVLDGLDGLIITGGRDIEPAAYGHEPHPATDEPARDRDAWEFALLAAALRRHTPVLGICRGAQILNVALGGTLHQHLPDVIGHNHKKGDAVFATSTVRTAAGTRLAAMVGESVAAQCYHHQAIDRLGEGLVVSATDDDGVIEAVEIPGHDFVVAVQWHPEETLEDVRILQGLVDAARAVADERVSQ